MSNSFSKYLFNDSMHPALLGIPAKVSRPARSYLVLDTNGISSPRIRRVTGVALVKHFAAGLQVVLSLSMLCEDIIFPALVSTLKKEIQHERTMDTLKDVGPHTLELWKVSLRAKKDFPSGNSIKIN